MQTPITVNQMRALRVLANDHPLIGTLCDELERLRTLELAAVDFVTATEVESQTNAAIELCTHLNVRFGADAQMRIAA